MVSPTHQAAVGKASQGPKLELELDCCVSFTNLPNNKDEREALVGDLLERRQGGGKPCYLR
jgi:hypothetical protein